MLDFFLTGRQFGHTAAVYNVHLLGTQALGAAGCVHGDVAAAHNGNGTALHDGGAAAGLVCFHQVHAGQVLVSRVNALQALAGDAHKAGQTGAGSDIDCLKAIVVHQLVNGQHLADDHVALNINTQLFQAFHFVLHNILGQTELRNAVHQNAACNVQGFVYGNLIAQLGQVAGNGQAGRTCTDNCHLMAVRLRLSSRGVDVFTVPVSHKALQAHLPSHWFSCGQTRPQTAGSALDFAMTW